MIFWKPLTLETFESVFFSHFESNLVQVVLFSTDSGTLSTNQPEVAICLLDQLAGPVAVVRRH